MSTRLRTAFSNGSRACAALLRRPRALAFFSGALALAAFYTPYLWWLIFFALVPFIHSLTVVQTVRTTLIGSVLFGSMLIGGATVATLSATLPPSVGSPDPILERALVIGSWLLFFVPLVPTVVAWAFVMRTVKRMSVPVILGLTALWVVLEWSRMFLFNMATYAPSVDNPAFFSASFLGYVLADSESWLQFAALGGVYLLSAIVIGVNLATYRILLMRTLRQRCSLVLLIVPLILISFVSIAGIRSALDQRPYAEVAIGFMSLTRTHHEELFSEQVRSAVEALALGDPDLIVLPEGAPLNTRPNAGASGLEQGEATPILTSITADGPGVYARVAELRTVQGDLRSIVRGKSAIAPQGEYVASVFLFIAELLGMDDRVRTDHLSSARWGQGFSIGSPSVEASVIFCSEVLAPMLGRELVERQRASLLVFVLAHDQFDSPYTLTVDTLRFLKVRTVEASVPSVASAHDTPAYAFDRFGRVTMSLGVDGSSKYGIAHLEVLSTEDRR